MLSQKKGQNPSKCAQSLTSQDVSPLPCTNNHTRKISAYAVVGGGKIKKYAAYSIKQARQFALKDFDFIAEVYEVTL